MTMNVYYGYLDWELAQELRRQGYKKRDIYRLIDLWMSERNSILHASKYWRTHGERRSTSQNERTAR